MTPEEKPKGKRFNAVIYFPDLASGKAYQEVTITASNIGMAAYTAFKEIRKRSGVAKKQIHTMKLTVTEVGQ